MTKEEAREQAINKFVSGTAENEDVAAYIVGEGYDLGYAARDAETCKWVRLPYPEDANHKGECGYSFHAASSYKFCPNCGLRVEEVTK